MTCLLAVLLIALVASCGKPLVPRDTVPNLAEAYFPLDPGSTWTYVVRDSSGHAAALETRVRGEIRLPALRVVATLVEERGGVPGEPALDFGWQPVAYYRAGGFLRRRLGLSYGAAGFEGPAVAANDEPVLPLDPSAHRTWNGSQTLLSTGFGIPYHVWSVSRWIADSAPIEVGGGMYRDVLRIETTRDVSTVSRFEVMHRYIDWYVRGVGLVKSQVRVDGQSGMLAEIDLVSFERQKVD